MIYVNRIIKIAKKVNIIGAGEATHGQKKITEFRIKLFKELVKKCNYTVFVLEEQYSCCELINQYIQTGKGNPKNILKQLMFPWQNNYILNLIIWMRKYSKKYKIELNFKGIDFQFKCENYKGSTKIDKFVNNLVCKYNKISKKRDYYMFKIFMKFYDPSKKYFLYAHMAHLQKNKYDKKDKNIWFGNYLFKKFNNKYFAIGNTFYYGSYLAIDTENKYNLAKVIITKNITKNTNKLKNGFHLITNKNRNKKIYEGDAFFSSKDPASTFYITTIGNRFDAIIVINNEVPYIHLFNYTD